MRFSATCAGAVMTKYRIIKESKPGCESHFIAQYRLFPGIWRDIYDRNWLLPYQYSLEMARAHIEWHRKKPVPWTTEIVEEV